MQSSHVAADCLVNIAHQRALLPIRILSPPRPSALFRIGNLSQQVRIVWICNYPFPRPFPRHDSVRKKISPSPQKEQSRSVDGNRRGFRGQAMFGVGHLRRRRENQGRGRSVRQARVSAEVLSRGPGSALQGLMAKRSRDRRRVLLTRRGMIAPMVPEVVLDAKLAKHANVRDD
jgi:hypothetical protein